MASRPRRPHSRATDHAALLDCLLERHGSKLRRQAHKHSARSADAEDALQDACLQFLRCYEGSPDLATALPWLLVVVKHCAWKLGNCRRRRETSVVLSTTDVFDSERPGLTVVDERPGPLERVERFELLAERRIALARLKPDERTALLLLALGYSYREIAARQGWTYTKVNRCLSEGRAALRDPARRGARSGKRSI